MFNCEVTHISCSLQRNSILPNNAWHVIEAYSPVVSAIIIVSEPHGALETVSLQFEQTEHTWSAELLKASRWSDTPGVWRGLQSGYMLPICTNFNMAKVDVQLRLTLKRNIKPCDVSVTFAFVEYSRMRISCGMGGLMYCVASPK